MINPGWFGVYSQLKIVLAAHGYDFNENGDPITAVEGMFPGPAYGLSFFMNIRADQNDVVVSDKVIGFQNGEPAGKIAPILHDHAQGITVHVIA
jgi:hypothetical protein